VLDDKLNLIVGIFSPGLDTDVQRRRWLWSRSAEGLTPSQGPVQPMVKVCMVKTCIYTLRRIACWHI